MSRPLGNDDGWSERSPFFFEPRGGLDESWPCPVPTPIPRHQPSDVRYVPLRPEPYRTPKSTKEAVTSVCHSGKQAVGPINQTTNQMPIKTSVHPSGAFSKIHKVRFYGPWPCDSRARPKTKTCNNKKQGWKYSFVCYVSGLVRGWADISNQAVQHAELWRFHSKQNPTKEILRAENNATTAKTCNRAMLEIVFTPPSRTTALLMGLLTSSLSKFTQ